MRLVATASCAKDVGPTLAIWDVTSGSKACAWPSGHAPLQSSSMPSLFGIQPFGVQRRWNRLATAGVDGTAAGRTATGQAQFILTGHSGRGRGQSDSAPMGSAWPRGAVDNTARIWDLAPGPTAGKEIARDRAGQFDGPGGCLQPGRSGGWRPAPSAGAIALVGRRERTAAPEPHRRVPGEVHYLVFSPDGMRLFSAGL